MLSSQIGEKEFSFGWSIFRFLSSLKITFVAKCEISTISVIQTFDRFCSCDSYTDFIWYKKGGRTTIMMKMIMLILSLNDHDSLMYLIENQMLKSEW